MIDLSNNNGTRHNWREVYKTGHRRCYLKAVEGMNFVDRTYPPMKEAAEHVGIKVGPYNFLHPRDATPREVLRFYMEHVGTLRPHHELRPCFDCEEGKPNRIVGQWIEEVAALFRKDHGYVALIYGSGWWLEACEFKKPPGPLWLASFSRNDGKEHPVSQVPKPWKKIAALQFTSRGRQPGISGFCDLNHVFHPNLIDIPPKKGAK